MRKFALLFCLLFSIMQASAQYPKYIISLTDKNNSPYSFTDASKYLSTKAIERRARFNIAIDSFDLPVNPNYINQILAKGNVQYLGQSKWLNDVLIYCTDTATINSIRQLPFVKKAEGVAYIKNNQSTTDHLIAHNTIVDENKVTSITNNVVGAAGNGTYSYGINYDQVHIHNGEFLHNKGYNGKGITIAVLDAGFNKYKELTVFDSIRNNNQVLGIKDFVDYDNSVDEDDVHGRYCLSIIAANIPDTMVGTAPGASFYLLRTENTSSEYPVEEHNWVVGAEYADSCGADMISSSLGYYYFDDSSFNHSYADLYANTTMVSKGAAMAVNKGLIVTNSAGNEGQNSWKYLIFPADADSVCTVGAVNTSNQIAAFSSYGYPGKIKPNIVSVGWNAVVYADNGPAYGNGTSFSNPNMNGLIACLWQAFPTYNNMTILNAVYQSADKYNTPDDQYGYGLPNMQTAYQILKHQQNVELYGNDWLFANPDPFTDSIHVKLIGRVDGACSLTLTDSKNNIIQTIHVTTEKEEVYDTSFQNLTNLLPGNYNLVYTDSIGTRNIALTKNGFLMNDWLEAAPVPFHQSITVYLQAPDNGNAFIKFVDASGKTIQSKNITTTQGNQYNFTFSNVSSLADGIYFIQYKSSQHHKTIKVVKQ